MNAPDPVLLAPHVSNRVMRGLFAHLALRFGDTVVRDAVAEAGLPWESFDDPEGWTSTTFGDRFVRAMARRLYGRDGLPGISHPMWGAWREAGRASLSPEAMGAAWHLVRALGAPGLMYRQVPRLVALANRTTRLEVRPLGPGKVEVRATAVDEALPDTPWSCATRAGYLEGIPGIWGLGRAEVSHPRCLHDGGDACVYEVRYPRRSVAPLVAVGATCAAAAAGGSALGGALGAAAGVSAAMAALGWWRASRLASEWRQDAVRLDDLVTAADDRYAALWEEGQQLRRSLLTTRKISGYLAQDLVERIVKDPELELTLGGARTDAAVLFADIVGFTPRCERAEPEVVVADLNTYFAHVDPVVATHGGVIDKRIGDGIMVVFVARGGEGPDGLHRRAIGCARGMLRALDGVNAELAARGAAPFRIRVGLAAGPLVQGNMGSPVKLEYTVVGDVVNTAARLEGQATPGHVLLPLAMLPAGITPVGTRSLRLKGKEDALEVAELGPAGG